MSRHYKIVPTQSTAEPPADKPPDWTTDLCDCTGQNACCSECCLVAVGLDFLLYKDTEECYTERQRGLKHDNTRTYVPSSNTLETYICNFWCRDMGLLMTCGLAAGSPRGDLLLQDWPRGPAAATGLAAGTYCCRCCMFNQLNHQLVADNPNPPSLTQQQVNSMCDQFPNRTWLVSNKTFNNPPNDPSPGNPSGQEYV